MFVLVLIGVPVVEVFVFIEVGRAIGWLLAVVLLLGTSVLGAWLLRIQGRSAIERVSLAVSEHRAPARAAIDGALGFLGGRAARGSWVCHRRPRRTAHASPHPNIDAPLDIAPLRRSRDELRHNGRTLRVTRPRCASG